MLRAGATVAVGATLAGGVADGLAEGVRRTPHRRLATGEAALPTWRSRPDLQIPALSVTRLQRGASDLPIFLAPYNKPGGQAGAVITDSDGEAIWENPVAGKQTMNFRVQQYLGSPVLTWWQGNIVLGHGVGEYVIADAAYRTVRRVQAEAGLIGDLHEFVLTARGTALLTSYVVRPHDLTSVGGSRNGTIQDAIFQEIDLASGQLLLEWHSLDHVELSESYAPVSTDWDFFHINSVDLDHDGNLLVSSRSAHTIYKVASGTGDVLWRLGGKASDFAMGPGTTFAWQHDVRRREDGALTVFDNGSSPAVEALSRALVLDIDEEHLTVTLHHQYTHPGILAASQGSVQTLANGNIFVGWGAEPYVSEFAPDGRLLFDARLGDQYESYRAFRAPWVAQPAEVPAVVVTRDTARVTAYASWNGATEVAHWRLLADSPGDTPRQIGRGTADGFETAITARSAATRFAVIALDRGGHALGQSASVAVS